MTIRLQHVVCFHVAAVEVCVALPPVQSWSQEVPASPTALTVGTKIRLLAPSALEGRLQGLVTGMDDQALLLFVGIGIGLLLPSGQIWTRFPVLLLGAPLLALADVWLFRSGRSPSFWVRACGFEICTIFGAAACARYLLDLAGVAAYVGHTR